ncbi:MAG TPA: hypothetical protein VFU13_10975 [Steroidobacteraceae bacterium]|nr:hypothetical protein [Steroidobacteraceae bacterium]
MHPTAADTIGGIARWWLDCADPPALIHVEAALDSLVQRGLLVRNPLPDGNHIYARSSNQTGEPQCPKP